VRTTVSGHNFAQTTLEMAESDVSIKITAGHHTSTSETRNSSLTQPVTTSVSKKHHDYLHIFSDARIPCEMPITAAQRESDTDVTDIDTQSQCVVQQQRREDSNSTKEAVSDTYMIVMDDSKDHVYTTVIDDSDLTDRVGTQ
jgi:hypothetical protein